MDTQTDRQLPHLIDMLSALAGVAISRQADELAIPLLDAVRAFRPHSPRLDAFEGWFCIRRGDLPGAARHLTAAVDGLGDDAGPERALLAMVNCAQGNPVWAAQAQTVLDNDKDPSSVKLVRTLSGAAGATDEERADTASITPATPTTQSPAQRRFSVRG